MSEYKERSQEEQRQYNMQFADYRELMSEKNEQTPAREFESSASIQENAGTLVIRDEEIWFYHPCPSFKGGERYAVQIPTFEYDDDHTEFLRDLRKAIDHKLAGVTPVRSE